MNLINNSFGLGQRLQAFPPALVLGITEPNKSTREIKMQEQLIEQWKPIKDYEGLYEISNYGYVVSEAKEWHTGIGTRKKDRTILLSTLSTDLYYSVNLHKDGKKTKHQIHILVWDHFGDQPRDSHRTHVHHKDEDKLNCGIDNLQLLSARKHRLIHGKDINKTSEYDGVSWYKRYNKWVATIHIDKKDKFLGYFTHERQAHTAYERALSEIK